MSRVCESPPPDTVGPLFSLIGEAEWRRGTLLFGLLVVWSMEIVIFRVQDAGAYFFFAHCNSRFVFVCPPIPMVMGV